MNRIVLLALLMSISLQAIAHMTVKTDHVDVNLWSMPGDEASDKIDEIKRFEEVQVIETKDLANGETWYRVNLRRLPNWREEDKTGWVNAKFFNDIDTPVDDDQPKGNEANCPELAGKTNLGVHQQITDIKGVTSKIDSQDLDAKSVRPGTKNSRMAPSAGSNQKPISRRGSQSHGFIWPTAGVVRSGFGMRRHPVTGVVKMHNGTDISGNSGKDVVAAKTGVVKTSKSGCQTGVKKCNGGAGNMIIIDHQDGTMTKYMHLSPGCKLAPEGSKVEQGQKIACVGSTGESTGPHLHFGVVQNGRYINPLTVLPKRN